MGSSRAKISVVVVVLLGLGVYMCARKTSEHRAEYTGRLTFCGHPRGFFDSVYTRVFWRRQSSSSMPEMTVHVNGHPHRLAELTPESLEKLGDRRTPGRLRDADYNGFQYQFENGRLASFSWSSGGWSDTPPPDQNVETLAFSIGDSPPLVLPISHKELVRLAGRPVSTYLTSGQ